MFMYTS